MEIFELRYFLASVRTQNLQKASRELRVAPSSLSKAIARLEAELGVRLFAREGRQIRVTERGLLLAETARRILELEESARASLRGAADAGPHAILAGPEVLLSEIGLKLTARIQARAPRATFEFRALEEKAAIAAVHSGEAHLALVTGESPAGLASRSVGTTKFETCVGPGHPLYARAARPQAIPVAEVLAHAFASPSHAFLGQVSARQSSDGWRDDAFPRRVGFVTSSLELLGELVTSGQAVAYLPDYWVRRLDARALKITDCPYICKQKIRLIARDPARLGWLNALF